MRDLAGPMAAGWDATLLAMNTLTEPRTCGDSGGRRVDGAPCGMNLPPDAPSGALCPLHDPAMKDEMQRRRLKGNVSRSRLATRQKAAKKDGVPEDPDSIETNTTYAAWTIGQMADGLLDPKIGHEILYGLRVHLSGVEKRDLLRELTTLRKELADARAEHPKPTLGLHRGKHA